MRQDRIPALDLLRVLAAALVVLFHFGCAAADAGLPWPGFLRATANFEWGNVAVTAFVALSGALLFRRHGVPEGPALREFYRRRALAVYPPFWITCLYIPVSILRHWLSDGDPFRCGSPWTLLLAPSGLDGYLASFGLRTYAFCGDWFVGAIALLYAFYPALARAWVRSPKALLLLLAALYAAQSALLPPERDEWANMLPATLALKFCAGFALAGRLDRPVGRRAAFLAAALVASLALIDVPGRGKADFFGALAGFALFPCVLHAAPRLLRQDRMSALVRKAAGISYCVFLVQHVGIVWSRDAFLAVCRLAGHDPVPADMALLFAATCAAVVCAAALLKRTAERATRLLRP
ncbi:MAG: acyltransferase [Fibrobacterales bacterium]|nr:acyltransferase [Fibrobacterales bacterium]